MKTETNIIQTHPLITTVRYRSCYKTSKAFLYYEISTLLNWKYATILLGGLKTALFQNASSLTWSKLSQASRQHSVKFVFPTLHVVYNLYIFVLLYFW